MARRPISVGPTPGRRCGALHVDDERLFELTALATFFIVTSGAAAIVTDTWWALKMGQLSVQAGGPVLELVLAHAPSVPDAANGQWLAQVLLYLLYGTVGEVGLKLATAILATASLGLVMVAGRLGGGNSYSAGLSVLLAALLAASNLAVRSQLFSYLLFAVVQLILQVGGRRPRALYLLPPVFAAWANLHVAFVLGLLLVAAHTAATALEAARKLRRTRVLPPATSGRLALVLMASAAATCLNPLGPGVYDYVAAVVLQSSVHDLILEWAPPTLHDLGGLALAASMFLLTITVAISQRPIAAVEILLVLGFGGLALTGQRHIVWWGLVLAPILARHAAAISVPRWLSRWVHAPPGDKGERGMTNVALAGLILVVAISTPFWRSVLGGSGHGRGVLDSERPVGAADFLAGLPAGGLYNAYPWTGYLAWRLWPAQPPMVDVRVEAHPEWVWADYLAVRDVRADWEAILAKYEVDYLVLPAGGRSRLARLAENTRRWDRLYEDRTAVVLGRRPSYHACSAPAARVARL